MDVIGDIVHAIGSVHLEHWRDGELLETQDFHNGITNLGKNLMLDRMFNAVTTSSGWTIGLIDNASFSALNANDIMTVGGHTGWVEWSHTPGPNRLTWGQGTAAAQQVVNAALITVAMTASGILQGVFICDDGTKGGTIGNLWATALFNVPLTVQSGDNLKLTYAVQL